MLLSFKHICTSQNNNGVTLKRFIYHIKEHIDNNLLLMKAFVELEENIEQLSIEVKDLSKNLTVDFQMMYESQCLRLVCFVYYLIIFLFVNYYCLFYRFQSCFIVFM